MRFLKRLLGFDAYTSEIDSFLTQLNENRLASDSQRQEKEKYERINALRDESCPSKKKNNFWDRF